MFRKLVTSLGSVKPVRLVSAGVSWNHPLGNNFVNGWKSAELFQQCRSLQTSGCRYGNLMEFFDEKKNWGETNIRTGRSWKLDELRIKSNSDLHKLWYVLLKERNMLMTMEEESKRQCQLFPNPERIDKVEESMANVESVVRERNRAFHQLETGYSGERPGAEEENFLGLPEYRQFDEYPVPKEENKPYLIAKRDEPKVSRKEKAWFLVRWKEKQRRERKKLLRLHQYEVVQLLQIFPDLDVDALKEQYPDVDVDKYVTRVLKDKHQGNFRSSGRKIHHYSLFRRHTS